MPLWRRNLHILVLVQLLSTAGFSLVFPFLPLYVSEIGIATRGSIEFWVGLVFSSQAVTMMISAPVWGGVADRYGRKLMRARAILGGAILLALMGVTQNAEQLALLRTIQGGVTGVVLGIAAVSGAVSAVWLGRLGDRIGHPTGIERLCGRRLDSIYCRLDGSLDTGGQPGSDLRT